MQEEIGMLKGKGSSVRLYLKVVTVRYE